MPPLAGFFGKFFLFKYLAVSGNMTLAAIAGLASGISVYAYIRILKPIFFGDSEPQAQLPAAAPSQRLGAYALIAVLSTLSTRKPSIKTTNSAPIKPSSSPATDKIISF